LSATGTISYAVAMPIILGQNIGTTITPILSSINGNKDAKRVAFTCLYIKIIGVVVVSVVFYVINSFVTFPFMKAGNYVNAFNIAVIHTLFNIISTIILIPFNKQIEKLAYLTIKNKGDEGMENDPFATLDDRFFTVPGFAVEKCRELTYEMAKIAQDAVFDSTNILNSYDRDVEESIAKLEKRVDQYEDKISAYLVDLSEKNLNTADAHQVTKILHIIGDVERISDHALNICETAEEMYEKKINFSDEATKEIGVLTNAVREILSITTEMLEEDDIERAKRVEPLEQIIDTLKKKIKNNHVKRLQVGECTVELGFILSDLLTNYERIADHCSNIAVAVLGNANGNFEAHDYMNHVKNDGENEFFEKYDYYKSKYSI
jgi:phosphate:Na+ symporter